MSSSIANIVGAINDGQKAVIKIVQPGGEEKQLDCIFREDEEANFFLVFKSGMLPEDIDLKLRHKVVVLQDNKSLYLNAKIIGRTNDRTLQLVARETLDPASLREYFRVNTSTEITASHMAGSSEDSTRDWTIDGQTQDLSGSGVLAIFHDEPKHRDHIHLEIYLPNTRANAYALGHVVRKKLLRSRRWQVSFHFDNISQKHRDAIITYLLSEQRKQLREKVRTSE